MSRLVTKICQAARNEEEENDRRNIEFFRNNPNPMRAGINLDSPISPVCSRHIISLDAKPVTEDMIRAHDKSIRATKGVFFIKYLSQYDKRRVKGRPFVISQDLFHYTICLSGYPHFQNLAKYIPEVKWLLEWTTFDPYLFSLAKNHSGIDFAFTIDWRRYATKMFEDAKEQGVDLHGKSFVSYKCSRKSYEENYSDLTVERKDKNEYLPAIIQTNKIYSSEQGDNV